MVKIRSVDQADRTASIVWRQFCSPHTQFLQHLSDYKHIFKAFPSRIFVHQGEWGTILMVFEFPVHLMWFQVIQCNGLVLAPCDIFWFPKIKKMLAGDTLTFESLKKAWNRGSSNTGCKRLLHGFPKVARASWKVYSISWYLC